MSGTAFAVLRRSIWALGLVLGVATASFFATALLPGDPLRATMGPQARAADLERARAELGLDRPITERYLRFLGRTVHRGAGDERASTHTSCHAVGLGLHVDLGHSFSYGQPVAKLVAKKLPATLELAAAAALLQLVLGLSIGTIAATGRGRARDDAAMGVVALLSAAPTFVIALLLQHWLAHRLRWLPLDGYGKSTSEWLAALVLPAATLGLWGSALFARLWRTELGDALGSEAVRAARARGASRFRAALGHAFRPALAPVAQLTVLELGALVGGAIVTERIFRWPGLGEMAVVAVQNRDAPAVVGVTLVASTGIVLATVVADLVGLWLDPRLRR
jgi:peptide/nickel transport system permease protein